MNKKIIMIVCLIILTIILLLLNLNKNEENKIKKYLINQDFIKYNDTYLYSKKISTNTLEEHNLNVTQNIDSEYEILYFNINTFQLTKDKITYSDGITKNFTPTFDYTNNNLNYTYRVNFYNTNIVVEGTYDIETKVFTCESTFSYQIDIDKSIKDICNKVKLETENFDYEAKNLIKNSELLSYMKKKTTNNKN